jgi:hypothetical protein
MTMTFWTCVSVRSPGRSKKVCDDNVHRSRSPRTERYLAEPGGARVRRASGPS